MMITSISIEQSRCSNGPYLFDDREHHKGVPMVREGLGQTVRHMIFGFSIAELFNLTYIYNPDWFVSEHYTNFEKLFSFEHDSIQNGCTFQDLHSSDVIKNVVDIESVLCGSEGSGVCEIQNHTDIIKSTQCKDICAKEVPTDVKMVRSMCDISENGIAITADVLSRLDLTGYITTRIMKALSSVCPGPNCRFAIIRLNRFEEANVNFLECLQSYRLSFHRPIGQGEIMTYRYQRTRRLISSDTYRTTSASQLPICSDSAITHLTVST